MKQTSKTVCRTYYVLTAGNTLAASLIWGINTIFLLDAGLNNTEAFQLSIRHALALLPALFAKGMSDRTRWDNPQRFSLR